MRRPRKIRTSAQLPKAPARNLAAEREEEERLEAERKARREERANKLKEHAAQRNFEQLINLALQRNARGQMTVHTRTVDGVDALLYDAIDDEGHIQATFRTRTEAQAFCNYFDEEYRRDALFSRANVMGIDLSSSGDRQAISMMTPDGRILTGTLGADGLDQLRADGTLDPSSIRVEQETPDDPEETATLAITRTGSFEGMQLSDNSYWSGPPSQAARLIAAGFAVPAPSDTYHNQQLAGLCGRLATDLRAESRPVSTGDLLRVFSSLISQLATETKLSRAQAFVALMRVPYANWYEQFMIASETVRDRMLGDDDFDNVNNEPASGRIMVQTGDMEFAEITLAPFRRES